MFEQLGYQLKAQKDMHLYRKFPTINSKRGETIVVNNREYLNFASNDYLGIASDSAVRDKIYSGVSGYSLGSGASRVVTGNSSIVEETESILAEMYGAEECLIMNSGYQLNLSLFSNIFSLGETVFYDKQVHNSIITGLRNSKATFKSYKHNDYQDLKRVAKGSSEFAIVTESIFSMSGEKADINTLATLSDWLIVDEAHTFGVLGKRGCGISQTKAFIRIGTFGKAFGLWGGFILCSKEVKEFLINFAHPLIYTTALPDIYYAMLQKVIAIVYSDEWRREKLKRNVDCFQHELKRYNIFFSGENHIISIPVGDAYKLLEVTNKLKEEGFWVLNAKFPTVPLNKGVVRISLNINHSKHDLIKLAYVLNRIIKENK